MSTRSRLISLAVLATAAAAPGAAHAATNCSYNGSTHHITVTMFASGDSAKIARSGSAINVNDLACGAATVSNTDLIDVSDASGGDSALAVDLSGGALGPGLSPQLGDPSLQLGVKLSDSLLELRVKTLVIQLVQLAQFATIGGIHHVEPIHELVGDIVAKLLIKLP